MWVGVGGNDRISHGLSGKPGPFPVGLYGRLEGALEGGLKVMDEKTVELIVRASEAGGTELVLRDGDGQETVLGVTGTGNKRARLDDLCALLLDNIDSVQDALCELL